MLIIRLRQANIELLHSCVSVYFIHRIEFDLLIKTLQVGKLMTIPLCDKLILFISYCCDSIMLPRCVSVLIVRMWLKICVLCLCDKIAVLSMNLNDMKSVLLDCDAVSVLHYVNSYDAL
jgi:hypothetical protein